MTDFLNTRTDEILRFGRFWKATLQENFKSIVTFTLANLLLTAFNEFAARSLFTYLFAASPSESFFLRDAAGSIVIHKQSLINLAMTFLLSFVGGPIYFFEKTRHRFMFFMFMGLSVSFIGQMAVGMALAGALWSAKRFVFDLAYNAFVKYPVFEGGRPWMLKFSRSVLGVVGVRCTQDFVMTTLRVAIMIAIGLDNH